MAGNFGYVDDKLKEADFFLEKLHDAGADFEKARFYFSAFVSASRSITFVMQFVMSDSQEFKEWYANKQTELKSDSLARFFLEVRNEVQKRGSNPLASFSSSRKGSVQYYFVYWYGDFPKDVPDLDVISACKKYLTLLVKIVYDSYRKFGALIDPDQYYTTENIKRLGLSIEDVLERDLGFPGNWANEVESEAMLKQIRDHEPKPQIDHIFIKYLGLNRFGDPTRL